MSDTAALERRKCDEAKQSVRARELSIGRLTIFDTPIISIDRRPREGRYGPRWGNK